MRILAISDEPSGKLWGGQCREALAGVDLILSAGDLPSSYLSFLTCFTDAPIVYVHGNHDDHYEKKPPEGSFRYRPDCINMYTEQDMASRISSLRRRLRATGGFDVLLTHAPIRGLGDEEHLSHRGFECFGPLLDRYRPAVMVHGHMHQAYTPFFQREREYHGIPVINASTAFEFDLPETPDRREPSRRGLRLMEKASRFE